MRKLDEAFFVQFNSVHKFKRNQLVLWSDIEPTGIFYVKSGFIRQYFTSRDGKEITVNILKPGTLFPMIWALNNIPNVYFYESLTKILLLKAPRDEVIKQLKDDPDLLYELTKRFLSGLDGITKTMDILLTENAYQKISYVILILGKRFGKTKIKNKNIIINIPLTHRLIGTLAGLSRESTSLEIEKLTQKGIISKKNGFIFINNMKKLEKESQITDINMLSSGDANT